MEYGVALPTMVQGIQGRDLLDWARRAEALGFADLAVLDRLVYGNTEPLVTLAAAAAATERIRLTTGILIAPYRSNTALVAKQAASVAHLSDGRLTLGVAVGARPDDYAASGAEFGDRGRRLDTMLAEMRKIWAGGEIGPEPPGGEPEILVGGRAPDALRRVSAHGDGYFAAAGPPKTFAERAEEVRRRWREAGRPGDPRVVAQAYYALGPGADAAVREHLGDYYSFAGKLAEMMIKGTPTEPGRLRETARAFADAGCDELVLVPCASGPDQLDRLADALGEAA